MIHDPSVLTDLKNLKGEVVWERVETLKIDRTHVRGVM